MLSGQSWNNSNFRGKILRYFPLPFCDNSRMAEQKSSRAMPFRCRISSAICNQRPLQFSVQFPAKASWRMSMRDIRSRLKVSSDFSISQPVLIASSTVFLPRFTMNSARSILSSLFCLWASARSSVYVCMPFDTAISETSNMLRRGGRFLFWKLNSLYCLLLRTVQLPFLVLGALSFPRPQSRLQPVSPVDLCSRDRGDLATAEHHYLPL